MGALRGLAVLAACPVLGIGTAAAQAPDPNFDANMAAMLGRAQQQNNAGGWQPLDPH